MRLITLATLAFLTVFAGFAPATQLVIVSNENVLANGHPAVNPALHVRWEGIEDSFFPEAEIIAASVYPPHPQLGGLTKYELDFCVPGEILSGNLLIGSDNTNKAYLNGQYVGGSNDEVNYQPGMEDNHDVSAQLRAGNNHLTILVHNLAQFGGTVNSNPTMLIFELLANYDESRGGCIECGTPDGQVPEPSTLALAGLGAGLVALGKFKNRI